MQALSDGLVHVLWLGAGKAGRPAIVDFTVSITESGRARAESLDTAHEWNGADFAPEALVTREAQSVARRLSPLYDAHAVGSTNAIPAICSLSSIVDFNLSPRSGRVAKSMPVPIGVAEDGVFKLDLVKHGPHVLVGGTTGAGKSELLQSLVAGVVTTYSPTDVNLLLVDFKGGATFAGFKNAPHVVGFVSDLEPTEVKRALAFVREEMRRRLREFDMARTSEDRPSKDFQEYQSNRTEGQPEIARLIVIFDEFATLATEHSREGIMDRVVDIAQRGRSVGVHLVLATQQPSSEVVSAKVKANVGAAIALRTMDASNSDLIVGAPDAALIPKALPGRAVARLEEGRLIQFQAALAGSTQEALRRRAKHSSVRLLPLVIREAVEEDEEDGHVA